MAIFINIMDRKHHFVHLSVLNTDSRTLLPSLNTESQARWINWR